MASCLTTSSGLRFPCGPVCGIQSASPGSTERALSAQAMLKEHHISHFSEGSAVSTAGGWGAASVPHPGPRDKAGMRTGYPRAGKRQHSHQRGFCQPRGSFQVPHLPPAKQMWLDVDAGLMGAGELLPLLPTGCCAVLDSRGPGGGGHSPLGACSSITGVPNKFTVAVRPGNAASTFTITWCISRKGCSEKKLQVPPRRSGSQGTIWTCS